MMLAPYFQMLAELHSTVAHVPIDEASKVLDMGIGFSLHGIQLVKEVFEPVFPPSAISDDDAAAIRGDIHDAKVVVAQLAERGQVVPFDTGEKLACLLKEGHSGIYFGCIGSHDSRFLRFRRKDRIPDSGTRPFFRSRRLCFDFD